MFDANALKSILENYSLLIQAYEVNVKESTSHDMLVLPIEANLEQSCDNSTLSYYKAYSNPNCNKMFFLG